MPSTVIRRFDYDPAEQVLIVTFTTGRVYRYVAVPPDVAERFRGAFAKGRYFNARIRDNYEFTEIEPKEL
jgi:lysyl-tRNA synthetase class 2